MNSSEKQVRHEFYVKFSTEVPSSFPPKVSLKMHLFQMDMTIQSGPTYLLLYIHKFHIFTPKTQNTKTKAMIFQTWLPFIFLIILTNLSAFVTAQDYNCSNDDGNSAYMNNLNTLLLSLSSNIDNTGFYNASQGENPDQAYTVVLCRADIQLDSCRSCVQDIRSELQNLCPSQTQGIMFKEFCMLRYSNESIFGNRADRPFFKQNSNLNVSNPNQFKEDLGALLDNLSTQAAAGGSLMKVATGRRQGPNSQTIFALSQCTPDISQEDCSGCLMEAAKHIPLCCNNDYAIGVRILQPTCNLRYEISAFYNITRIQEAQANPVVLVPPPAGNGGGGNTTRTVIFIIVPIVVFLILAACVGIFLRKKRIKKKPEEKTKAEDEIGIAESLQYDFTEVRAATDDFSDANKLGEGGFGAVYRGILQNGQEIAVKRLSWGSGQGDLEFKNEVLLVAGLQHRNLVRLFGFAIEGTERLLVYEFVENASLDHFIFESAERRSYIDWDRRYKIIVGIARGLLYLHEDSRLRVIHRDLKPSNILLDREMNPKIADFGMARLFVRDESAGSTSRIVGTYGYMAPEYIMHGQFSVKSDVFSFGVLVLEIISGQKNSSFQYGEVTEYMLSFAWRNWCEGTMANMIDPVLRSTSSSLRDMLRCIHISLLCVQENAADRPTMASIVLMLNSLSVTLAVPKQPAFFIATSLDKETWRLQKYNSRELEFNRSTENKSSPSTHDSSKNEVSITELQPR